MKRTIQFAVAFAAGALFSTAHASVITLDAGAPAASYQSFVNASKAGAINIDSAIYGMQAADADWASASGDVAAQSVAVAMAAASAPAAPVSPVPEPGIYAMLLIGLGLLGFTTRREASDKFSV